MLSRIIVNKYRVIRLTHFPQFFFYRQTICPAFWLSFESENELWHKILRF